jgi:hypothetical protein
MTTVTTLSGPHLSPDATWGATASLDCKGSGHVVAAVTLTANCALTVSNMPVGARAVLVLTQDATGSRTLALTPTPKTPGGLGLDLSSTPGAIDVLTLVKAPDGTLLAFPSGGNMS